MTAASTSPISKRLVASYVLDWIVLVGIGFIAYGFHVIDPHYHDFSVLDLNISYPLRDDTVTYLVAAIAVGVVPAIIILVVSLAFVPGIRESRNRSWGNLLRIKLWEWHTGWLGLAMSLATAVAITEGLKNFGKPRPNALARCRPDLANIQNYYVGGFYAEGFSNRWALVSVDICQQTDRSVLNDGFQSWPSGHSSTSWAGLLYLALYLCSKFAVVLPYLPSERISNASARQAVYKKTESRSQDTARPILDRNPSKSVTRHRDEAAAPPVYMLFFVLVPLGGALYICLSRWMDYAHHGFDIISGSLIGIVCSYVSFRWYHLPVSRASGWSWGPRSADRAFGVGVGRHGYVDEAHLAEQQRPQDQDIEMGPVGASTEPIEVSRWAKESDIHAGTPLVREAPHPSGRAAAASRSNTAEIEPELDQAPHAF